MLLAVAIAAPSIPKRGINKKFRITLDTAPKPIPHAESFSYPVIINRSPTDPANVLTSCPIQSILKLFNP